MPQSNMLTFAALLSTFSHLSQAYKAGLAIMDAFEDKLRNKRKKIYMRCVVLGNRDVALE